MIDDVLQLIELGGPVVVALLVLSVLGLTVFLFMADVFFPRPWWAPGLVVFAF